MEAYLNTLTPTNVLASIAMVALLSVIFFALTGNVLGSVGIAAFVFACTTWWNWRNIENK